MSDSRLSGKVTLTDLFTFICVATPLFAGWAEGSKVSFWSALVGMLLGICLGVLSAIGFRKSAIWIAERRSLAEIKSIGWQVVAGWFLLALELAWVFGMSWLILKLIRAVIRSAAA